MMRTLLLAMVVLFAAAFSQTATSMVGSDQPALPADNEREISDNSPKTDTPKDSAKTTDGDQEKNNVKLKKVTPLTKEMQKKLLGARLGGGMGYSFSQFANQFFVFSRIDLGVGIGLETKSQEIAQTQLSSPFPESYEPTLNEFLDAIALQTSSDWSYDPDNQFVHSEVETDKPIEGIAIFEFKPVEREKPYEVTLADGWKTVDNGNWVMHVPPDFPVGMDIYEMGTYSTDENEDGLANRIRKAVSLEWAQRVNEDAVEKDLKPAKVGEFDALYYESMIPSQLGKEIKWRHWVFMSGHRCYFIVSTILPSHEETIYPDVQSMLKSFRVKKDSGEAQTAPKTGR